MGRRTPCFKVRLEPRVVKWLVESSGMDHGAIAQKMSTSRAQVDRWVGTGEMEYSGMRRLAKCVRRPETLFLLKTPPREEKLEDYRAGRGARKLAPQDVVTVRRVRYSQSAAREMMEALGMSTSPRIPARTAADNPAEAAREERRRLGVGEDPDGALAGAAGALYGELREAIEGANIFVFQYPMDAGSVSGLALAGSRPHAIMVNSRDSGQAKALALLHEYGHVLLREGGICSERGAVPAGPGQDTEAWCRRFAAAFLMPAAAFVEEMGRLEGGLRDPSRIVGMLAKKFRTSGRAAAARAAELSSGGLRAGYMQLPAHAAGRRRDAEGGGGVGRPRNVDACMAQLGRKFTRLALLSDAKGVITGRDLVDYTGMSLGRLGEARERLPMGDQAGPARRHAPRGAGAPNP